jgi:Zn-dependent protease/CBS domain-containing protein
MRRSCTERKNRMRHSLRIGRLFGIELLVDSSWVLIFVLVTWSLASLFTQWHPDWAPGTSFVVAIFAALAFFFSVLLHEIAHSLVARAYGVPVRDITLHMFGGVSNIEREPPTPGAEFLIAIVGPITSVVIGVALLIVGAVVSGRPYGNATEIDPTLLAERMGPVLTLLMWLGPINILVGVFNLIPGFPLDGGRVLRAILWRTTGDLGKATRWSAAVGQAVGFFFIALGALMVLGFRVPFFGRGFVGGIWLALIGLFLRNAAVAHWVGSRVHEALEGVRVRDLMRTRGAWVDASTSLRSLVDHWFSRSDIDAFPVFDQGQFVGAVTFADVRSVPPRDWDTRAVRDVVIPADRLPIASPDEPAYDALRKLSSTPLRQIPVVGDGRFQGLIDEQDIARFVDLANVRGGRPGRPAPPRPRHA